ncbi:TraR/DksA family transcriptional regulator [Rhodomicrobium sp. Az07]|uniref:TraR/DksA family transcriptional regulator n=1 Tax=Rhodomicrobium sp. Az07 TaxID=2839034 RepID=UPI001BE9B99F|nr:TraR/DksA family transcriptional regulator [Rhodomicrobium sp. Az07]MBT3070739.1 TraR/DksA family transcriptional regulator [Rhodomicrobium sp. Az07]
MADLDAVRQRLLAMQEDLAKADEEARADRAPVELDQSSVGRLSRMDAMQMQAMAVAAQQRRRIERAMIEAALRRIEAGEYGYCVGCGEPIAPARLANSPAVPTCLECAKRK